jgi:hypothetical protein
MFCDPDSPVIWKQYIIGLSWRRTVRICAVAVCLSAAALPAATLSQSGNPPHGNGKVSFLAAVGNEIISLSTKLVVPNKPPDPTDPSGLHGTVFLWPGLQPRPEDANYWPIGDGILQPVLTWGPSCAPGDRPKDDSSWWISAQYVNTLGNYMGYQGCYGGTIISAEPKDLLRISMSLFRSIWTQTILNLRTNESTGFRTNLVDQAQGIARFHIEPYDGAISPDVVFLETAIGFARPHLDNCRFEERGPDDVVTTPVFVDGGQSCYIDKIILKTPGKPPSAKAHPKFQ